jgi:hypothetical protein
MNEQRVVVVVVRATLLSCSSLCCCHHPNCHSLSAPMAGAASDADDERLAQEFVILPLVVALLDAIQGTKEQEIVQCVWHWKKCFSATVSSC